MTSAAGTEKQLQHLVREYQELNGSEVDEVEELSLVTLGRYVAKNRPFVVRGYGVHWPCMAWTADALRERVTDDVEVASSPHGLADAIYDDHFVEPYTERLSMSAFLDRLADSSAPATYLQSQDGNLLKGDLAGLLPDVCADIAPATELFGAPPDAVNLWVGDARSTTSLHKDPYENLYLAVQGTKTFTLYAPTEYYCMHERTYRPARWVRKGPEWLIEPSDTPKVPWLPIDPLEPDYGAHPRFRYAQALRVTLHAGDLLYLPALWFHHVQQAGDPLAIAVNWWYDMAYDSPVWSLHRLVRSLTLALDGHSDTDNDGS